MTVDKERLAALRAYGYTERESRFLYLVATHSGYFMSNHFVRFIQTGHGRGVNSFITKAIENHHVRPELHSNAGAKRYLLYARNLYRAIGKENSRNRRRHRTSRINVKLCALQFVLDHLDYNYLDEETDKVSYFVKIHGVDKALLPARVYKPKNSHRPPCTRYFVDKYPIYLAENGTPVFTFVDNRETSTEAFRTHLLWYLPLLQSLPVQSKMLFVSPVRNKFSEAARVFDQLIVRDARSIVDHDLLNYFDLRHRWEAKDLKGFTKEMFRQRIEGEKDFSTPYFENLYRTWLDAHSDSTSLSPEESAPSQTHATSFDTHWIHSVV